MNSAHAAKTRIRQPRFADNMWYSANADTLKARITNYLADPPLQLDPESVLGVVAPHAGHRFSGHVAGAGFANLPSGLVDTVILLGPDHRGAAPGRTSTPAVEMWHTPLGNIPVAWELLDIIKKEVGL
ncbi:MAG: AmmeMemoRadiSam system protein B, partial [Chloroflexi bacterium]